MITTSRRSERRGVFRIALILSLLVNLIVGSSLVYVYGIDRIAQALHLKSKPTDEYVATSNAITIEKRNVPRPTRAHHAVKRQSPAMRPHPPPRVATVQQPKVVAIVRPTPVPTVQPTPIETPKPAPRRRAEVAKVAPRHIAMAEKPETPPPTRETQTPPPEKSVTVPHRIASQQPVTPSRGSKTTITSDQIAALEGTFRKTIAEAQSEEQPIRPSRMPPVSIKHYSMQFEGIHAGLSRGQGYIEQISRSRVGNTMWYYTHYEYMNVDGSVEQDDIPWPFHYPIGNDPFARGDRYISLQSPPPGYVPTRPLKHQLQIFFPSLYPGAAHGTGSRGGAYGAGGVD